MIEYISGRIDSVTPAYAVIDCAGVGYLLNITLPAFDKIRDLKEARLLVHEVIREDAHSLFGFIDETERALFRLLIGVSGVGANTARIILSAIPAPELEIVISSGDHARLKGVKGIGAKTAQRIVVDLKDKIQPTSLDTDLVSSTSQSSETFEEALAALVILGFNRQASQKVLRKLFDKDPAISVDRAIKAALPLL